MLWFVEPDEVRDYTRRLRSAGGDGPVAAAMPLAPNRRHWRELVDQYIAVGTDTLILTSYGRESRVTLELEQFAAEVLAGLG